MALNDIVAALLMGGGGFSKAYGEGLQERQKTRDEYLNELNQLYFKQLLEQQDPYKKAYARYLKTLSPKEIKPPAKSEYQRTLDEFLTTTDVKKKEMLDKRLKHLTGEETISFENELPIPEANKISPTFNKAITDFNPQQEDWIARAMQSNPGMNREDIIAYGKRIGKL